MVDGLKAIDERWTRTQRLIRSSNPKLCEVHVEKPRTIGTGAFQQRQRRFMQAGRPRALVSGL